MMLTTHLHRVLGVRMSGDILLLPLHDVDSDSLTFTVVLIDWLIIFCFMALMIKPDPL